MSWIPFRKQQKKPHSDLVADNEFDSDVEKFNSTEVNTRKMYKDTKKYLEGNAGLMKAHQKLGNELVSTSNSFIGEKDEKLCQMIESINSTLQKEVDLQSELNANIRNTFIDPVKKFTTNFNTVNNAIKRREQSLQDYAKYLNRREKFIEKDAQNQSGKYNANEGYLNLAKADFERRNNKLLEELPKFYQCKHTYFEPCFQGIVESKYQYLKKSRDIFEELACDVNCPIEQWDDEQYKEETRRRLAEIKALSIVAEK